MWADDGLALRWPEGFTAIAATADDKWLFRDVPDEPDVAAEILVADGFAMADEAGNPLWLTDSDCMAGEGAWLRLTDCDMLVANARRAAGRAARWQDSAGLCPSPLSSKLQTRQRRSQGRSKP